ncbi:periplasmic protein TonB [Helicobacter mustelae]|uniref:TonB C-terminal domain-containing protein n=1 Tax=Helicobacter mustelae TaxID=217 RepID=UPI000DFECF93|nr:TonB C-terminal domain-containing protein [Helicobacter mustelae]STP12334.1 periplasmic protein TonB [Helicobacter mustelae]
MYRSTRYFYISGALAFFIYFALLFLIVATIIHQKNTAHYIMKNNTKFDQIAIDALIEDSKPQPKTQASFVKKTVEKSQGEPKSLSDIKDLFSKIPDWETESKEQQLKKQEDLEQKKLLDQELLKQQEAIQNLQANLSSMNKTLNEMKTSIDIKTDVLPNQDNGLYDEWIAKIYKILYKNWSFAFYQDATVSAIITITNTGQFSYKILKYSPFEEYNNGVIAILENLRDQKLPPYPNGNLIHIEVNFKARAKDE